MTVHERWNKDHALEIINAHKAREGAMLPILHALQHVFGYVPDDVIPLIADALNVSEAEVFGVITFYHDFRRKLPGRHVLKLCQAEACQACGSDALAAHAETKLGIKIGETTGDGRVTLEPVYCLGLCATAPSAMLDDGLVGRLDQARLEALLVEAHQ
jgi:formate dehydrogenase subunit gamma